jgi:hypothetical protein
MPQSMNRRSVIAAIGVATVAIPVTGLAAAKDTTPETKGVVDDAKLRQLWMGSLPCAVRDL